MDTFQLDASDGASVTCYGWAIESPKAVVLIAHGMGEHARRYDRVARALNAHGYRVIANDHRGHGATGAGNLGYMGPDGWNRVLADAFEINRFARGECPGLPVILMGHSMGSMMAQQYITRYPASIDALVLSGSPGFKAKSINPLPGWILRFEDWRHGPDGASELMQNLLFGSANKPFDGPDATGYEWLSKDAAEVKAYVDDPECGFVLATRSLKDLYAGAAAAQDRDALRRIPDLLPMYIFAGTADPVNGEQQDIERMVEAYREAGQRRMTVKWYQDGRHEMLNETNRDEVTENLVEWLDATVAELTNAS